MVAAPAVLAFTVWFFTIGRDGRVHLSASAVQRRVERLIADGVILGAEAKVAIAAPLRILLLAELADDTATTIERLSGHLARLLGAAVAQPEVPLGRLPWLGEAELAQLLREWNDTEPDWQAAATLHESFERQAGRTPDAEALVAGGRAVSYADLERRANRLARHLRRLGVGPERVVGVAVVRSAEMVVAVATPAG